MEATQVQQSRIGSDNADPTVLDVYAVLAYLRNETAAGLVTELLLSPTLRSAVNATEAFDQPRGRRDCHRRWARCSSAAR